MNKKTILSILIIITSLAFIGAGCKKTQPPLKANLVFWGVFDDSDAFEPLIKDFKTLYPGVNIEYRKKTIDDYEKDLVNALAEGRGPDIFMIHHTWLGKHKAKLTPIPPELINIKQYKETFVDVASADLMDQDGIYGLPLYIDTLALFYNKDFFNNIGLVKPPADWKEFQDTVSQLTKRDEFGNIIEAGAAIGTAKNINRSPDILAALMIQEGSKMTSENGQAKFNDKAGQNALRFYTDFANRQKVVYTWNPLQHYSIDAFTERKTAMMFNYSYMTGILKAKDSRLNFKVAAFPQIDNTTKTNFANYWVPSVSVASQNKGAAWLFLKFISGKEEAQKYINITQKPAARLDIIQEQKNNLELGVFAEQTLTAQSWYQSDNSAIDIIIADAIENVAIGKASVSKALSDAEEKVNGLK